jgi:predicted flap endonuclease-1-like 5' DNA nuclease
VVYLIAQTLIFLLLAMVVGVVAGWMLFGGGSTKIAESVAEQQALEEELTDVRELLSQRESDVTRLRGKLRLAATELEKRANQVSSARRAHAEIANQFAEVEQRFSVAEAERMRLQTLTEEAATNPTLWAAEASNRNVEAAVAERNALHEAKLAEVTSVHERNVADITSRYEAGLVELKSKHEDRVTELSGVVADRERSLSELQQKLVDLEDARSDAEGKVEELNQRVDAAETEVVRVVNEAKNLERDLRQDIQQREIELSSARLRTESARNELAVISTELVEFRKRNNELLQDSHTRLSGLTGRVDTAHSILSGQTKTASPSTSGTAAQATHATTSRMGDAGSDELLVLPGMTPEIAHHLRELEVRNLADVASWTAADVTQYEAWLPDHPGIIRSNDWVGQAKAALDANRKRGASLSSNSPVSNASNRNQ